MFNSVYLQLLWYLVIVVLYEIHVAECAIETASCRYTTTPGAEFAIEFELDAEGDTVTNISFYDASEDPNFATEFNMFPCLDDTPTDGSIFNVQFDVDIDDLPCGAQDLGENQYKFAVVAGVLNQVNTFICDLSPLQTNVSDVTFETTVLDNTLHIRNNPRDVKFQAIHNDYRIPVDSWDLGEYIKFRLIYDRKYTDNGPDNMGYIFHTAPLIQALPVTEVTFRIITLSLGTRVHVTGRLVGNVVDEWRYIKVGNPGYVSIPVEYVTSANGAATGLIEEKGLKIESIDARVGVSLTLSTSGGLSRILVLPDKVLDNRYRLTAIEDWFVTIIGTTDGTTLDITTNTFGMVAADITLVGGAIAVDLTAVPLDEGETLTINCSSNALGCSPVFVVADQPIAVIVGGADSFQGRNRDGEMSAQIPGLSSCSTRFTRQSQVGGEFRYYVFSDKFTDDVINITSTSGSKLVQVGDRITLDNDIETDKNVLIILGLSSSRVAISILPSIEQWSLYQSFFLEADTSTVYIFYILATEGHLASITFDVYGVNIDVVSTNGTLGGITDFEITPITGVDGIDKEQYTATIRVTSIDANRANNGIITFHASTSHKPFLIAYEKERPREFGDPKPDILQPAFGLRLPPINPCVPSMTGQAIHPDFATAYYTGPGDMLDNDCDGRVDEEWEDGLADLLDDDDLVDEDLALKTEHDAGLYVNSLIVSNTADFTGVHTQTVHTRGCNINSPRTVIGSISEFKHNSNLASIFDQFYVIETDPFKAFGWINDGINPFNTVYVRVYFGFCYGTLAGSRCENSCENADILRKRDIGGSQNFVDLKFDVTKNNTTPVNVDIKAEQKAVDGIEKKHQCLTQTTFWTTTTFIMLMIPIESAVVVILLYRRSAFQHMLKQD